MRYVSHAGWSLGFSVTQSGQLAGTMTRQLIAASAAASLAGAASEPSVLNVLPHPATSIGKRM
jgi:hypothetical protein